MKTPLDSSGVLAQQNELETMLLLQAVENGEGAHNNLAYAIAAGEAAYDSGHTIVMPFYRNGSLRDYLSSMSDEGQCEPGEIQRITRDLLSALDFIRRKEFVHRDVKPDNILIDEDGTIALADFGCTVKFGALTDRGTPQFDGPETINGEGHYLRTPAHYSMDLFSTAVMLRSMMTFMVTLRALTI